MITERLFSHDAYDVYLQAQRMKPEDRLAYLSEWVLPGPNHATLRLYGGFVPSAPAPPIARSALATKPAAEIVQASATGSAVQQDASTERIGQLVSPAILLVQTAKRLGKLDELSKQVAAIKIFKNNHNQRSQVGMTALIRLAQGKTAEADQLVKQMFPLVKQVPPKGGENVRWPELVTANEAIRHRVALPTVKSMLRHIAIDQTEKQVSHEWDRHLAHLRGRCALALLAGSEQTVYGTSPGLKHWTPVTHTTAMMRGTGTPMPHWNFKNGALHHFPGHNHDGLYFRIPIRGNFEVTAEVFGWREIQFCYGGIVAGLGWHRKSFFVSHFGRDPKRTDFNPPLKDVEFTLHYRLVVQDGQYTSYVNGRKFFERRLPENPDPWFVLYQPAGHHGGLRNLKITGTPTVPTELNLSAHSELTGWLTDYYDKAFTGDETDWKKEGEVIVGQKRMDLLKTNQESVLHYHRPLLEDGELEYEFFYKPGETMVHPALDRLTFLLEPSGVRVHWMTDAQYERNGLLPDNVFDEPQNRRGPAQIPLKPGSWNKLKLALTDDVVSIALNGVEVYQRKLEMANQRNFGLFHYVDETEVRVRNVVYRGKWPSKLPGSSELFLANSTAKPTK